MQNKHTPWKVNNYGLDYIRIEYYLFTGKTNRLWTKNDICYVYNWWRLIYKIDMLCYAKSLQLCPTLCDPIDGSPPGSPVPGILQARTLEWVAISFSSAWKWKVKVKSLRGVRLLVTPWTAAHQAPLSMG